MVNKEAENAGKTETVRLQPQSISNTTLANKEAETVRLQPQNISKISQITTTSGVSQETTDGDYDPHLHRDVPKPTNNFETLIHILKCSLGTGILAMPQSFSKAGVITGSVVLPIVGIMITHCLQILIRSQYELCKRKRVPLLTYPDTMVAALEIGPQCLRGFAKFSAIIVDFFLIVYQMGIGCVYIVFIATTAKKLLDPYHVLSVEVHMLIILLPIIGANCIPNLKIMAPFSTFANFLIFVGLGIILYYLLTAEKKSNDAWDLWGSPKTFPLFFGSCLFALTAVGVIVAIENNMKTPKDFGTPMGVLNIGMGFIIVLYVLMGVIGYSFCVSDCADSISLDLPEGSTLSTAVSILFAIAILISYALQCYVPVEIIWKQYTKPRLEKSAYANKLFFFEYALRVVLCLVTFVVAVAVPELGLFISLFGALCLSALGMIFPAIIEICIKMPNNFGPFKYILIKDIVLFSVGLIGMVIGTFTSVQEIISKFLKKK